MYPVITVPAFNDNYIWLIRHENHCLVVDPGDAAPVLERLEALQAKHGARFAPRPGWDAAILREPPQ